MPVLEPELLTRLTEEFRLSMRRLLRELVRELQCDYAALSARFSLPVGLFHLLSQTRKLETYSNWKVVGWIEAINDLAYFLDILRQWEKESEPREFTKQFFTECQETFFEHDYQHELFPSGHPQVTGLANRVERLCARLAQEVTQEAIWFDPALAVKWCRESQQRNWRRAGLLGTDFERGEMAGTVPDGITGDWREAPKAVQEALRQSAGNVSLLIDGQGITVKIGRVETPLWYGWGSQGRWLWARRSLVTVAESSQGAMAVGPTLVYGKDREPKTLIPTNRKQAARIGRAWKTVQAAWPDGHAVLALLTSRIIPLKAEGVVSFSYRHRPGLSFINCFDRDNLDLIDDLIHENSHHYLNLLLRKYVMYHGDHNRQIFYSPWRRSLRPLRSILHATFTFTMGAMLFERLSSWGSGRHGAVRWKQAGLSARDLQRARFRCLEEVESVRYSLQDLHYADRHLGWLTGSGRRLVGQLAEAIGQVERASDRFKHDLLRSNIGPALRRHSEELRQARLTYGPTRLSKA